MAGHLYLQRRFKSLEARQRLLMTLWADGVDKCMTAYGIKSREQFARFITKMVKEDDFKPMSPLAGISGGQKFKILIEHQDMIMEFEALLGKEVTRCIFNLSEVTLENLKAHTTRHDWIKATPRAEVANIKASTALSAIERLEKRLDRIEHIIDLHDTRIEKAEEGSRVNAADIRQQLEQYSQFVEKVSGTVGAPVGQFFKMFIAFFLQRLIPIDRTMEILEQIDPLDLEALIPDSHKRKRRAKALKENPLLETIEKLGGR